MGERKGERKKTPAGVGRERERPSSDSGVGDGWEGGRRREEKKKRKEDQKKKKQETNPARKN